MEHHSSGSRERKIQPTFNAWQLAEALGASRRLAESIWVGVGQAVINGGELLSNERVMFRWHI